MALKATILMREAILLDRAGQREEARRKLRDAANWAASRRQPRLLSDAIMLWKSMGGDAESAARWAETVKDINATRRFLSRRFLYGR